MLYFLIFIYNSIIDVFKTLAVPKSPKKLKSKKIWAKIYSNIYKNKFFSYKFKLNPKTKPHFNQRLTQWFFSSLK